MGKFQRAHDDTQQQRVVSPMFFSLLFLFFLMPPPTKVLAIPCGDDAGGCRPHSATEPAEPQKKNLRRGRSGGFGRRRGGGSCCEWAAAVP